MSHNLLFLKLTNSSPLKIGQHKPKKKQTPIVFFPFATIFHGQTEAVSFHGCVGIWIPILFVLSQPMLTVNSGEGETCVSQIFCCDVRKSFRDIFQGTKISDLGKAGKTSTQKGRPAGDMSVPRSVTYLFREKR